jgi:hypothetical protein
MEESFVRTSLSFSLQSQDPTSSSVVQLDKVLASFAPLFLVPDVATQNVLAAI